MTQTILSLAKTTRPTLTMVTGRARLFASLDAGVATAHAMWIAGPPGAGKTTLIASYLEASARPHLWYQLDAADGDVATFLYYLRQTALKHSPAASTPIPELRAGDDRDWSVCARSILRAIYARFPRDLALTFDNVEEIPRHSALHAILALIVDETPPGRTVFMLSRNPPPPALARAQMNRSLCVLPAEDLRLSVDECQALAQLRNSALSNAALDRIQIASAGWIAGAILLMEHAKSAMRDDVADDMQGVLYDYVAHEIFQRFDADVQRLLLAVCWMRRLSLSLAEAVTGDSRVRQVLVSLALNNYFVTERDDHEQREYILHPLLREFLQARAQSDLDPRRLAEQQLRCAEVLLESGNPEEAIELLVNNLAWDRLEAVILTHAPILVSQARLELLCAWIDELPLDRVMASAWLTYWQGRANLGAANRASRRLLQRALRRFVAEKDNAGILRAAADLIEHAVTEMDDLSLVDEALEALAGQLNPNSIQDDNELERARVMAIVGTALRPRPGDVARGRAHAPHAGMSVARPRPEAADLRLHLALAGLVSGSDAPGEAELIELARHDDDEAGCRAPLLLALHRLLYADPAVAWQAAVETLGRAHRDAGARELRLARIACLAAALLSNRLGEVTQELDALRADVDVDDKLSRCLGHYILSWAALCEDDVIAALRAQQRALASADELGMPFLEVLCRTALAQLLFLCGDARTGSAQLRRVHALARDLHNPLLEHLTLLVYGDVAVREGRRASGVNALRYAFGLGRQHGYLNQPWWQRARLADLCVFALEQDIEAEFVRLLVRRHQLRANPTPVHLEHWPWPLKLRGFGRFEFIGERGVDLLPGLGQGRPLQLLKLIAGAGAGGIRADAAAEIMWPHVENEYAMKSLTINLHRLRRLIPLDDVVLLRDGRLSLNPEHVFSDTRAFEAIHDSILAMDRGRRTGASVQDQVECLFGVYRGPWGADDDTSSIAMVRDRLRAQFVEAVKALVDEHAAHDLQRAHAVLERALLCEPAEEALHAHAMRLAIDAGNRRWALELYARCQSSLAAAGCEPGPAVQALHDTALFMSGPGRAT